MFMHDLHHELWDHDIYFDLILSDINYWECPILLISDNNKPQWVSLNEARKDAIQTAKRPLIILNEINISFLSDILELYKGKRLTSLTIMNLATWMWSLWNKICLENQDLDIIPNTFSRYEPIDLENLWNLLKKWWLQYIRIPHKEMPDAIFNVDELWIIDSSMLENLDSISLKSYWFWWNDWTLFSSGSLFSTAIQTWDILKNYSKRISIFIFQKLNTEWTEEMIESIKATKKLYILIDHKDTNELKKLIESKIKNLDINDVKIYFLTPEYEKLTTILDVYQDEQANFDPENLAKRIIK